jgi:hypothetical protein
MMELNGIDGATRVRIERKTIGISNNPTWIALHDIDIVNYPPAQINVL